MQRLLKNSVTVQSFAVIGLRTLFGNQLFKGGQTSPWGVPHRTTDAASCRARSMRSSDASILASTSTQTRWRVRESAMKECQITIIGPPRDYRDLSMRTVLLFQGLLWLLKRLRPKISVPGVRTPS